MTKYRVYMRWGDIVPGYYNHRDFLGFKFECGLMMDRDPVRDSRKYYYFDERGREYTKDEFRVELQLRKTNIWKVINLPE